MMQFCIKFIKTNVTYPRNMIFKPVVRIFFPLVSLLLAFSILAFQHSENEEQSKQKQVQYGVNLVELFTSQGCSSCPPADVLLSTIKNQDNVIALSYHVDYWNHLGWKDPYSNQQFSDYQRNYAQKLSSGVYTPQMVVNGKTEFVGSKKKVLEKSISTKSTVKALPAPVVTKNDKNIEFTYSLTDNDKLDSAYALLVLDEHTTEVSRGENSQKKLKNSNVVVQRVALDIKNDAGEQSFEIDNDAAANYKVAIVAQDKNLEVVAAGISSFE